MALKSFSKILPSKASQFLHRPSGKIVKQSTRQPGQDTFQSLKTAAKPVSEKEDAALQSLEALVAAFNELK